MGEENMKFVNIILKKLINQEGPQLILEKISILLDDEAEVSEFKGYG